MKKVDYSCFGLSLILNLIIILIISNFNFNSVKTDKIKVGLISVQNNESLDLPGEKNVDSKNKINTTSNEIVPEKDKNKLEETIEKNKTDEIKIIEDKPKVEENVAVPNLEDLGKSIEVPNLDNIALDNLAKNIEEPNIDISNTEELSNDSFNPSVGDEIDVDRILEKSSSKKGLPSGSRMGTLDGKLIIDWNPSNNEPKFPEKAKRTGKTGKVILVIKVNSAGKVTSVRMERGSGVPEINAAIEEVARTWDIKLMDKGKSVNGTFVLEYNFTFN